MAPLKRHPALVPLSKDHHFGLLLCWKIREGLANEISLQRIADYLCWFFVNHLKDHFALEENYIFPLVKEDHSLRREAIDQHRQLEELYNEISLNPEVQEATLIRFEKLLEKHIRMEERSLFQVIQQEVGEEKLKEMEFIIGSAHHQVADDWQDPFWLRK